MASDLDIPRRGASPTGKHVRAARDEFHENRGQLVQPAFAGARALRIDAAHEAPDSETRCRGEVVRYPQRLAREAFYTVAYPLMVLARRLEERLLELFQRGYVKGTVTDGAGNEAAAVGMAMPLRPGRDVVSLLHRDLAAHLLLGATPYQLVCQYLGNADSPTHAREGNAHHGDAGSRRLPMISHLGKMLSLVVGGTWAARRNGEDVFGLAVIGDGGSSTGEFHEALNLASVHKVPVLLLIENNHYAFSTPTSAQYRCRRLSDRAAGYGISGQTIDGTDPWKVYTAVCEALDAMADDSLPAVLECMTLRLHGHAAYDKAQYISPQKMQQWRRRDPLPRTRRSLLEFSGCCDADATQIEQRVEDEVQAAIAQAMKVARPSPTGIRDRGLGTRPAAANQSLTPNPPSAIPNPSVYADSSPAPVPPYRAGRVRNGEAVNRALDYILSNSPRAFLTGMDVGTYGSAFKTCKGLIDRYGAERVIDMPICESGIVGMALGASQVGAEPIIEFQFADFSTEATTQLGLNAATWYFRTGRAAPMLLRLPCGGGLTMGAFHSGEFEGLWSRFPGLKLLYPATPQETFEALVAGFYDRNPCLVFEHKLLYWSTSGEIDFDGDLDSVWRPRQYTEGSDLTLVAFGAMVHEAIAAAETCDRAVEVFNPFVLQPMKLAQITASVEKTGRLMVVQECGAVQGLGDQVIASVVRRCRRRWKCRPKLVAAADTPVPFAPELESHHRPNRDTILAGIAQMFRES